MITWKSRLQVKSRYKSERFLSPRVYLLQVQYWFTWKANSFRDKIANINKQNVLRWKSNMVFEKPVSLSRFAYRTHTRRLWVGKEQKIFQMSAQKSQRNRMNTTKSFLAYWINIDNNFFVGLKLRRGISSWKFCCHCAWHIRANFFLFIYGYRDEM